MNMYMIVHGRPSVAIGAADDVVADDHGWLRLRYRCRSGDELLARMMDADGVITLDCSLFVQVALLYEQSPAGGSDDMRVWSLGTGKWAMEYLRRYGRRVCALTLPAAIYERVKTTNPESAQWLICDVDADTYYGLAATPMHASLDEWRTWLAHAFAEAAEALPAGADRDYQLGLVAAGSLSWSLMYFNCLGNLN